MHYAIAYFVEGNMSSVIGPFESWETAYAFICDYPEPDEVECMITRMIDPKEIGV